MIIDTSSQESMENSFANYYGISTNDVDNVILCVEDEMRIHNRMIVNKEAIQKASRYFERLGNPQSIDKLKFFHLTRRLNEDLPDNTARNLMNLLTSENVLRRFLKDHGIEFFCNEKDNNLVLIYQGDIVDLRNDKREKSSYLKIRLGYNLYRRDTCINGYAFKDDIKIDLNAYYNQLATCPEFISELANYLGCRSLIKDYKSNSKYYCYEYEVPIEQLIADSEDADERISEKYFIDYVVEKIISHRFMCKRSLRGELLLRTADDENIPENMFVSRELLC